MRLRLIEKHFNYYSFIVIRNGYIVFESNNKHPYEEKRSKMLKTCLSLLTKALGKPGEKFVYNSANTHLLSAIITNATNMSTLDFAYKFLFEPLGINEVYWEKDNKGFNFGGGNLFMSLYDLAKIGYLYLNNGVRDNKTIVSKQWIEKSLKNYVEWNYGFHYGYLWYLRNEKNEKTG